MLFRDLCLSDWESLKIILYRYYMGQDKENCQKKLCTHRMLVKYHHLVYLRSWSEFHRLLIPWFPACFRLVKSCHKPFDLLFKEVRRLSSAHGFISISIGTKGFESKLLGFTEPDYFICKFPAESQKETGITSKK